MSVSRARGLSLATLALGVLVAACSATPGSSGSPSGGGNGGPTAGPAGSECEGVPTFNVLASPQPSFATDTTKDYQNTAYGPALDNVSLTALPEPATLAAMTAGVVGLFRRRKSRRTTV